MKHYLSLLGLAVGSLVLPSITVASDIGAASQADGSRELAVYPPVPGLEASEFYSFRIREINSSEWLSPFAWITRCVDRETANATRYYATLADWSNTYINFEMGKDVLVEIDGQMDEQDTGRGYNGPPIHTVTVFANPFIEDKPDPSDANVFGVQPGEVPPDDGAWVFFPDVAGREHAHGSDTWHGFPVEADGRTVETGQFMGRVDITAAPWIYSSRLHAFVYAPEAAFFERGSWVYVLP